MFLQQDIDIKICGLTRPDDVKAAIVYGATHLGFIIEAESPRRLNLAAAHTLTGPARDILPCVAVTVNPSKTLIMHIEDSPAFTHIQLHGDAVSTDNIKWIKENTNLSVIRSIAMRKPSDLSEIEKYARYVDTILLDAPPPRGTLQEGGHGTPFDWTQVEWAKLRTINAKTPIGLAGGLTPNNVNHAKAVTGLSFFDVSTGVEQSAGVKEASKIKDFISNARKTGSKADHGQIR